MRKLLGLLALPLLVAAPALGQSKVQRPTECWVRRSVLDTRPRMVTVALHKDLYAAYDASSGQLYKVWKDGVRYEGTIWNAQHGPQPTANGPAYILNPVTDASTWVLTKGGQPVKFIARFAGYKWANNQVTFRTRLVLDDKTEIALEETPEYITDNQGHPGFERRIVARIPAGYELATGFNARGLASAKSVKVEGGQFALATSATTQHGFGPSFGQEGQVKLGGTTVIQAWFEPRALSAPTTLNQSR